MSTSTLKSACAECARETWHSVLGTSTRSETEEDSGYYWREETTFLECAGCRSTSIRKEFADASTCGDVSQIEIFPPRIPRQRPKWFWKVDDRFRDLFKEIYDSLGSGALSLPVMGARTILDLVIRDKAGDQGTFPAGLDALENLKLLSHHDRTILEAAIDAGSAAIHRGFKPKSEEVDCVIEIVEHLINSQYVLAKSAAELKNNIPKRSISP